MWLLRRTIVACVPPGSTGVIGDLWKCPVCARIWRLESSWYDATYIAPIGERLTIWRLAPWWVRLTAWWLLD